MLKYKTVADNEKRNKDFKKSRKKLKKFLTDTKQRDIIKNVAAVKKAKTKLPKGSGGLPGKPHGTLTNKQ